jgi:hypothetical protein
MVPDPNTIPDPNMIPDTNTYPDTTMDLDTDIDPDTDTDPDTDIDPDTEIDPVQIKIRKQMGQWLSIRFKAGKNCPPKEKIMKFDGRASEGWNLLLFGIKIMALLDQNFLSTDNFPNFGHKNALSCTFCFLKKN